VVLKKKMGLRLKKVGLCPRTRGRAGPAAAPGISAERKEIEDWRWVFVDETWFNTQMSRYWGWAQKGDRIPEAIPAGRWRSFTLLGALSSSGVLAAMTVEASTDTDVFLAFLDQVLCPKLHAGQIVVMDNLRTHKVSRGTGED